MNSESSKHLAGAILCGGENKRFEGIPKGNELYEGKTLFEHVHGALESVVDEIQVSVHDQVPPGIPAELTVIKDLESSPRSPMLAIHSLLSELNRPLLILPWDTPRVSVTLLKDLKTGWEAHPQPKKGLFVHHDGHLQPLPGIYPVEFLEGLQIQLQSENLSLINFLKKQDANVISSSKLNIPQKEISDSFFNVNHPHQLP